MIKPELTKTTIKEKEISTKKKGQIRIEPKKLDIKNNKGNNERPEKLPNEK